MMGLGVRNLKSDGRQSSLAQIIQRRRGDFEPLGAVNTPPFLVYLFRLNPSPGRLSGFLVHGERREFR